MYSQSHSTLFGLCCFLQPPTAIVIRATLSCEAWFCLTSRLPCFIPEIHWHQWLGFPLSSAFLSDHRFPSRNFRCVCSALLITKISSAFHYLCLPGLEFGKRCSCCLLLFEEGWIGRWPAGYFPLFSSDLTGHRKCWNGQREQAGKWKNNVKGATKDNCNAEQMGTGSRSSCWPLLQLSGQGDSESSADPPASVALLTLAWPWKQVWCQWVSLLIFSTPQQIFQQMRKVKKK